MYTFTELSVRTQVFALQFHGEAVHNGEMDVDDLAPCLIGLNNLCFQANRLVNGSGTSMTIRAVDFKPGSFEIFLHAILTGLQTPGVKDAKAILDILGVMSDDLLKVGKAVGYPVVAVLTLIGVARRLGRAKVVSENEHADGIEVSFRRSAEPEARTETVLVDPVAWKLWKNREARTDLQAFTKPLRSVGITEMRFIKDDDTGNRIDSEDALRFTLDPAPGFESDQTPMVRKERSSIVYEGEQTRIWRIARDVPIDSSTNTWSFFEGDNLIRAEVRDASFRSAFFGDESAVESGDFIEAWVKVKIVRTSGGGTNTTYQVMKVRSVISGTAPL